MGERTVDAIERTRARKRAWRYSPAGLAYLERTKDRRAAVTRANYERYRTDPNWLARHKARTKAFRAEHKDDAAAYARVYREKRQNELATYRLMKRWGLTPNAWDQLLASQGGGCAICGSRDGQAPRGSKRLAVDHDHSTGAIRGLLCGPCNRAVGNMEDDPDRLIAAARYLLRTQIRTVA